MPVDDFRKSFSFKPELVTLNNASFTPLSNPARDKLIELTRLQSEEGSSAVPAMFSQFENARSTFARFLGLKPTEVAFTHGCATSISFAALGYKKLSQGGEILTLDQEYPSNAYPWIEAAKLRGASVIRVHSDKNFSINWEQFLDQIHSDTQVVTLSWVQYQSGERAPLKEISDRCKDVGALFVVDGFQALGVIPFNIKEMGVDVICGASHKWLCGPLGAGFLGIREELMEDFYPAIVGATTYGTPMDTVDLSRRPHSDAKRFEAGAPALPNVVAAAESIKLFMDFGVENIYRAAMAARAEIKAALEKKDFEVLGGNKASSPILTFRDPRGNITKLSSNFDAAKVLYTQREDRIRLAPHGFTNAQDLQKFRAALEK